MNAGTVTVYLNANAAGFQSGLASANAALNTFAAGASARMDRMAAGMVAVNKRIDHANAAVSRATRIQGFVISALGIGVVRSYKNMAEAGAEFEHIVNNIAQAMQDTQLELGWDTARLKEEVAAVSDILRASAVQYGMDWKEMGDLVVEGIQNGIRGTRDAVQEFIDTAAEIKILDPAGKATLDEAGEILTRMVNIYPELIEQHGSYANAFTYLRNEIIATVNQAQSSVSEFSAQLTTIHSLTKILGLDLEEANSAFASLSRRMTTGEAATAYRALLTNILKQSDQTKKIAESLNIDYTPHALQEKGPLQFFKDLREELENKLKPGTQEYAQLTATLRGELSKYAKDATNWGMKIQNIHDKRKSNALEFKKIEADRRKIMLSDDDPAEKQRKLLQLEQRRINAMIRFRTLQDDLKDATTGRDKALKNGAVAYSKQGEDLLELLGKLENKTVTVAEVIAQMTGRKEATKGFIELSTLLEDANGGFTTLALEMHKSREGMRQLVDSTLLQKLDQTSILLGQVGAAFKDLFLEVFLQNQGEINDFLRWLVDTLIHLKKLVSGEVEVGGILDQLAKWALSPKFLGFVFALGALFIVLGPLLILISAFADTLGFLSNTLTYLAVGLVAAKRGMFGFAGVANASTGVIEGTLQGFFPWLMAWLSKIPAVVRGIPGVVRFVAGGIMNTILNLGFWLLDTSKLLWARFSGWFVRVIWPWIDLVFIFLRWAFQSIGAFVWRSLVWLGRTVIWGGIRWLFTAVLWPALAWLGGIIGAAVVAIAAAVSLPVWAVVAIIVAAILAIGLFVWAFWDELKPLFISIWEMTKAVAEMIWVWSQVLFWRAMYYLEILLGAIGAFFYGVWMFITAAARVIWNFTVATAKWFWDLLTTFAAWLWDWVKGPVTAVWNWFKDFFAGVWASVSEFFSKLIPEPIKKFFSWLWDTALADAWEKIKGWFTKLKELALGVVDSIRKKVEWLVNLVKNPIDGITAAAEDLTELGRSELANERSRAVGVFNSTAAPGTGSLANEIARALNYVINPSGVSTVRPLPSLAGAGMGATTITINQTNTLGDDIDVDRMSSKLARKISRRLP